MDSLGNTDKEIGETQKGEGEKQVQTTYIDSLSGLSNFLPSAALGVDLWEKLPEPETTMKVTASKEEIALYGILDELDETSTKSIVKPGRGRKKKMLKAENGDRAINKFFRHAA